MTSATFRVEPDTCPECGAAIRVETIRVKRLHVRVTPTCGHELVVEVALPVYPGTEADHARPL